MGRKDEADLDELVRVARGKGFLTLADLQGLKFNLPQIGELKKRLEGYGLRIYDEAAGGVGSLSQDEAEQIVVALRKGVPPAEIDVTTYSVGRLDLVDRFRDDLRVVGDGPSLVRFMNADWGSGKTHSLYLLRDNAFRMGFVVSIVSLSRAVCPLYDFMAVYNSVMWNLRTSERHEQPALENVLDRWLQAVREIGEDRARAIISTLPNNLICALQAYYESIGPIRRNEEKRMLVLNYLSGSFVPVRDLWRIGIGTRIHKDNALDMLASMCTLFKNLKYSGICILFDEAESIHSFALSAHRDAAFNNISHLIKRSGKAHSCYFLYATTPAFFDYSGSYQIDTHVKGRNVIELERLSTSDKKRLASRICQIYGIALGRDVPKKAARVVETAAGLPDLTESVGDFVRKCITVLDEIA